MTSVFDWFSFPNSFSVVCPECGNEALGKDIRKDIPVINGTAFMKFTPGKTRGHFKCDISCLSCGFTGVKMIQWPEDAFWKFNIRGRLLWAWSKEHSAEMLDYLRSSDREVFRYKYFVALLHIPEHFKLAKNRPIVIKKVEGALKI